MEKEYIEILKIIKEIETIDLPDKNNQPIKYQFYFGDEKIIREMIERKDLAILKGKF